MAVKQLSIVTSLVHYKSKKTEIDKSFLKSKITEEGLFGGAQYFKTLIRTIAVPKYLKNVMQTFKWSIFIVTGVYYYFFIYRLNKLAQLPKI